MLGATWCRMEGKFMLAGFEKVGDLTEGLSQEGLPNLACISWQ